jgi:hypothetical protein
MTGSQRQQRAEQRADDDAGKHEHQRRRGAVALRQAEAQSHRQQCKDEGEDRHGIR